MSRPSNSSSRRPALGRGVSGAVVARWTTVAATLTFCVVGIERSVAGATLPDFTLKKATLVVNDANRSARPKDRFDVRAEFERRSGSPSPNPALEPVTFSTGTFFRTVPAGAFLQSPPDVGGTPRDTRWSYKERPDLRIVIVRSIAAGGTESWSFHARGEHVDLARTANPITTRLVIGDALGFQTRLFDAAARDAKTRFRYPPGSETTDCGNGIVERGEVCDDGDLNSDVTPNACRSTCVRAGCGDGVVDSGEACDAGAANSDSVPDACRTDCTPSRCGDRVVDSGEDCDVGALGAIGCCAAGCRFEPAGHECRASAGVCDVAEHCDGASGLCPPDAFAPANAECRATAGPCDAPETCTGTGAECPPDAKRTTECRPAAGPCDVAERCDGTADACPTDGFAPSSVECRAGQGVCDPAEHCPGGAAACPSDAFASNGTTCDDANACTTGDACANGVCRGHSPDCGDGTLQSACGEECDDGPANSDTTPDACRTTCVRAGCGDGVVDGGEACDDGNRIGGDRCSARCDDPDADADGVSVGQGDCNDADPAIHPGAADVCGDGIDQDCSGGDRSCSALELTITSPAAGAVLRAAPITVRGTVSDPSARVSVQNVLARVSGTTFEAEGVVLFEGSNDLLARARDPRGAEATTRASVVLDTVAPVLAVTSPADRAVLATAVVPVTGTVSDATAVTCSAGGAPAVVAGGTVTGQAALVGGTNTVAVSCRDAAGNEANRALTLYLDAQPLAVTAIDPPNGATGVGTSSDIRIAFSEPVAAGRIGATTFFARAGAAVLPGAVTVSPDGMQATLNPAALPAGARIDVTVTTGVTDAAGNPLSTPFVSRFNTAGDVVGAGVIAGEVYDDSRSLPLVGAVVAALDPDTRAVLVQSETDERGRYLLAAGRADVPIRVTKAGFTSADRSLASQQGGLAEVPDARLTPLAASVAVTAVFGGVVSDGVGDSLTIPPGGLDADGQVGLTAVGAQGPRAPFPPGWTPLGIVEIAAPAAFHPPATLAMRDGSGAAAGKDAVFASYDESAAAWVALAHAAVPADGSTILEHVAGPGQIALLLPDGDAGGPPPVADGAALPSGVATSIPETAVGSGSVTPAVGRPDDASPATAAVAIAADTTLRSGSPLRGDFMELFVLRSGGQVAPLDTSQDMVAYRPPGDAEGHTLAATFAIAPSRTFGPAELSQGTITVTLLRGAALSRALVGSEGGGVQVDDGSRLNVPSGALPGDVPVSLRRVAAPSFPAIETPGLALLGGLDLDLADVVANAPVSLTLGGAAAGVPTGSQIVVAEVRTILGRDRLVLVALGAIDGDGITTITEADGVAFPGVRAGGRFGFYRIDGALAGIGGTAREPSGRRDGHAVEIAALPFVSVTDASGAFALVSPPGRFTLTATGATSHDQVTLEGDTAVVLPEIVIGATPPRVVSITVRPPPLDGDFAGPVVLLGDPAPEIDDDGSGESRGNGNGVIEAGERIALTVAVRNDGTVALAGGAVALRVSAPGGPVGVVPATIAVASLAPDEPVAVGPFVFDVPTGVDAELLRYTLAFLTDAGLSNSIPFTLPLGIEHPNVSVASEVTVRFSEPVVGADLTGSFTLVRDDTAALVPVHVFVSADGTIATARPLEPLADDRVFRITLASAIADRDGRGLDAAPIVERFRTEDRTPPAPIDPGHIEAAVPDENGFATIKGSAGSVNPDDVVVILNDRTGVSVVATVAADGSFVARIRADVGDRIVVIVRDRNDNEFRIDAGPFVRRDTVTGALVSVVLGVDGGIVPGRDGLQLVVPAGALRGASEVAISRVTEPFALPADIAADTALVDAFLAGFRVVDRIRIDADVERFAAPVRLVMPAPVDAQAGDLFLVVRERSVTVGGLLADLDHVTGLTAIQNPERLVARLEVIESATVKAEGGQRILSTDSPPFRGITESGVVTILEPMGPITFLAGQVRRDAPTGPTVPGAVVHGVPADVATAAFAAVTDAQGRFVAPDAAAGGPLAAGTTVSSRLDVTDPAFRRVIRRDVRGLVRAPPPPGVVIADLIEPFVLPAALPPAFVDVLGDVEPPAVTILVEGPSLVDGIARAGDRLTVTVTATDNDEVDFVGLDVDQGDGPEPATLAADGTFTLTPSADALITFTAQARDPSGNVTFAEEVVRVVTAAPGAPIVPGPLPGPPRLLRSIENQVSFDSGTGVRFSEPIDPATVNDTNIRVLDPEGSAIPIELLLLDRGTTLRISPKRNLRFGACYTIELGAGIRDLSGQSLPAQTLKFQTPQPVQVATIPLDEVEDVAVVGDVLVAVSHPHGVSPADVGTLHTFKVRDAAGNLLGTPVELASVHTNGRPLGLAMDGTRAFVANRFLGSIASKQPIFSPFIPGISQPAGPALLPGQSGVISPGAPIGLDFPFIGPGLQVTYLWETFPSPPSNIETFDLSDPSAPRRTGGQVVNFAFATLAGDELWNPNTWPDRIAITDRGVAVMNFLDNIEFFTQAERPQSSGLVGRIQGYAQTLGRCGGDPLGEFCSAPSHCAAGDCLPGPSEFLDAAFFDGFVVTLEQDGVRIMSTDGVGDPLAGEPTLARFPLLGTAGARVAAVPRFHWTDEVGRARISDMAFVASQQSGLTILDVSDPHVPTILGVLANVAGNLSFDICRGLVYARGFAGALHIVDFNDPSSPLELNDPGAGRKRFEVDGVGTRFFFSENANGDGVIYAAGEAGIAVVELRQCSGLGCGCSAQICPLPRTSALPFRSVSTVAAAQGGAPPSSRSCLRRGATRIFDVTTTGNGYELEGSPTRITADGESRLAIEFTLPEIASSQVPMALTSPDPSCDLGGLFDTLPDRSQVGPTTLVVGADGSGILRVFYKAPRSIGSNACNEVRLEAHVPGRRSCAFVSLRLVQPPVLLVHGTWGRPSTWVGFFPLVPSTALEDVEESPFPPLTASPSTAGAMSLESACKTFCIPGTTPGCSRRSPTPAACSDDLGCVWYIPRPAVSANRGIVGGPVLDFDVYVADFHPRNAETFQRGARLLEAQLQTVFEHIRARPQAIEKIDVITHSLGTGVTRTLIAQLAANGLHPVRKFISLDGTHRGTQAADCIYPLRNFPVPGTHKKVKDLSKIVHAPIDEGAICDLQTFSRASRDLQTNLLEDVYTHTVVGTVTDVDVDRAERVTRSLVDPIARCIDDDVTVDRLLGCAPLVSALVTSPGELRLAVSRYLLESNSGLPREVDITPLIFRGAHDFLVPALSQAGGLGGEASTHLRLKHSPSNPGPPRHEPFAVTRDDRVGRLVLELLRIDPAGSTPFDPSDPETSERVFNLGFEPIPDLPRGCEELHMPFDADEVCANQSTDAGNGNSCP